MMGYVRFAIQKYPMIQWGRGSAFMFGRVEGDSEYRIERNRSSDGKKWKFMISDNITYRYVDDREFRSKEEMEDAALEWIRNRKKDSKQP